ncbi:MAG: hypothetical protein R3A44_00360 [Caldilineaceae bacterium]
MQRDKPLAAIFCYLFFACTLFWILTVSVLAQGEFPVITQLTNEHTGVTSAVPSGFTKLNGGVYFGVSSAKGGLWQTDGTPQGTALVKDVMLAPYSLQRIDDLLYFGVYDEPSNPSLWKSDGASAGTVLVKDGLGLESIIVSMGGEIFFIADEPVHGRELWKSDGTPDGTAIVADLTPGPEGTEISIIVAGSDRIYFTGDQGSQLLWQSDGTAEGTYAVEGAPQAPRELVMLQDVLYFAGTDEQHGDELWRYAVGDATASLVADIFPGIQGSNPRGLLVVNDRLFFSASNIASSEENNRELWQSNGTTGGTSIVKDIVPGIKGSFPDYFTKIDNRVIFSANTPEFGSELWISDGTAAGTQLVKDIVPGPEGAEPFSAVAMPSGQFYFTVLNEHAMYRRWQSDGTAAGTVPSFDVDLTSVQLGPFTIIDDQIYASGSDTMHNGALWISDGTVDGTKFVAYLDPNHIGLSPETFAQVNQRLYYAMPRNEGAPDAYTELWMRADRAADVTFVADQVNIEHLQSFGNILLVIGADDVGSGLWRHDGSTASLELLKRIETVRPYSFAMLNDQLYFVASNGIGGTTSLGIWRTDGTAQGTVSVTPLAFGGWAPSASYGGRFIVSNGNELWVANGASNEIDHFVPAGLMGGITWFANTSNALYLFALSDSAQAQRATLTELWQVWRTDGTPNGTYPLQSNASLPYINDITVAGDSFYFTTHNPDLSCDLWCGHDGSPDLANVVHIPSPPNRELFYLSHFQGVGDRLFFTMNDNVHGRELWTSDCTAAGTKLVKDIAPPTFDNWYIPGPDNSDHWSFPGPLFACDGELFFGADDGVHGKELWRSDGTAEGTVMVKDIYPGILNSAPDNFMCKGDVLFFTVTDGIHGRELWQSDGAEAGTRLVADLYAGAASAQPNPQLIFESTIYLTADNGLDGRQIFALYDPGIPLDLPSGEEPGEQHQLYMPLVNQ